MKQDYDHVLFPTHNNKFIHYSPKVGRALEIAPTLQATSISMAPTPYCINETDK